MLGSRWDLGKASTALQTVGSLKKFLKLGGLKASAVSPLMFLKLYRRICSMLLLKIFGVTGDPWLVTVPTNVFLHHYLAFSFSLSVPKLLFPSRDTSHRGPPITQNNFILTWLYLHIPWLTQRHGFWNNIVQPRVHPYEEAKRWRPFVHGVQRSTFPWRGILSTQPAICVKAVDTVQSLLLQWLAYT